MEDEKIASVVHRSQISLSTSSGLTVKTFCVHGSSTGRISGIEGVVRGGTLRFPSIPFIPALPYNVLDTDYRSYALVEGAKDSSFVQIYSRKPNPGKDFIAKQKKRLATEGYDPGEEICSFGFGMLHSQPCPFPQM